jgi:hypothetical protein
MLREDGIEPADGEPKPDPAGVDSQEEGKQRCKVACKARSDAPAPSRTGTPTAAASLGQQASWATAGRHEVTRLGPGWKKVFPSG